MPARLPLALLGAAAVLMACGAGPKPGEVARGYVASADAAKCDAAALSFLERETGRRGEEARAACRRAVVRSRPPRKVRVTGTTEHGDRAEVTLVADGQRVVVRLQRSGARWVVAGFGGN